MNVRKKRIEVLDESISDASSSEDERPTKKLKKLRTAASSQGTATAVTGVSSAVTASIETNTMMDIGGDYEAIIDLSDSSSSSSSSSSEPSSPLSSPSSSSSQKGLTVQKPPIAMMAGYETLQSRSSGSRTASPNPKKTFEVIEIDLVDDDEEEGAASPEASPVEKEEQADPYVQSLSSTPEVEIMEEAPSVDSEAANDKELISLDMYAKTASTLMQAKQNKPPLIPAANTAVSSLIPLRKRANSDIFRDKNPLERGYTKELDRETPEKWRNRLWPGKAIIAYCRIITRCKPPKGKPGKRLDLKSNNLIPHWKQNEIRRIDNIFESPTAHSAAFFLLTVEESRAAVTVSEDIDTKAMFDDRVLPNSSHDSVVGNNGWLDCEILNIVAESEYGSLPQACDPRLGSVWVISVIIRTPNVSLNEAVTNKPKSANSSGVTKEASISGGDLMLLHSPQWKSPLLGIVQPWDPDYDIKFGTNFALNQSSNPALMNYGGDSNVDITTANLLVCVDGGDGLDGQDIGGWAPQGAVHSGVVFSMAVIGNVMTYIRECQALMSLRLLSPALRDTIITNPHGQGSNSNSASSSARQTPHAMVHGKGARAGSDVSISSIDSTLGNIGPAGVPNKLWKALCKQYNDSQLRAIRSVCRRDLIETTGHASPVCLLQGPPGTGKTKTILGVLSVLLAGALKEAKQSTKVIAGASFRHDNNQDASHRRNRSDSVSSDNGIRNTDRPRVLVCAPSNTAVDELVFRMITQGILDGDGYKADDLCVVRIGHASKEEYAKKNKSHVFIPALRDGKRLSSDDYNVIRVVESVSLDNIVEDRRRALQASDAKKQLGISFKYADIRKQVLERADIVCCTLSGAGSQPILEVILRITGFKFDAVIIDEAAQAVEPSSLIPFKFNPQLVVMVGDPCQLPATVFSKVAKESNYGQSLFYRLQKAGHPVSMLETQYRMHPLIAKYPSYRFYDNKLITDESVIHSTSHVRPYHKDPSGRFAPFVFHDLLYSQEEQDGSSIQNREEAKFVLQLFDNLIQQYPAYKKNIGIIAPYRSQRRLLVQMFRNKYGHNCGDLDTEIATVDGFQGREKDIIIFSCVRSSAMSKKKGGPGDNIIGFLREWQRLNVAITRAKYALWIVGNIPTLDKDNEWKELIKYATDHQSVLHYRNLQDPGSTLVRQEDLVLHKHDKEHKKKKKSRKEKKRERKQAKKEKTQTQQQSKADDTKEESKKEIVIADSDSGSDDESGTDEENLKKHVPPPPPPAPQLSIPIPPSGPHPSPFSDLAPVPPHAPFTTSSASSVPSLQMLDTPKLRLDVGPFSSTDSLARLEPPLTVDRFKQIQTTVPFAGGITRPEVKHESRRDHARKDSRERHHSSHHHHSSSSTSSRHHHRSDSRDRRDSRDRGHRHHHRDRDHDRDRDRSNRDSRDRKH